MRRGNAGSCTGYQQLSLVISEIISLNRYLVQIQGGGRGGVVGECETSLQVLYFFEKKNTTTERGALEGWREYVK